MLRGLFISGLLFSSFVLGGETHRVNGEDVETVSIGSYLPPALFSHLSTSNPDPKDVVVVASTTDGIMNQLRAAKPFRRSYIYVVQKADETFWTSFQRWKDRAYYASGFKYSAVWFVKWVPVKWSSVVGYYELTTNDPTDDPNWEALWAALGFDEWPVLGGTCCFGCKGQDVAVYCKQGSGHHPAHKLRERIFNAPFNTYRPCFPKQGCIKSTSTYPVTTYDLIRGGRRK
ncbi:hypothetical protein MCOR27_001091 [Pyricularia oryzae]|nr:hypothetical protein MCOR19_006111 [Pyricularia oryzae]KAI6288067.1 hypothetical protein MCOR27_001091 [Pyricularia oryzae]KAI6402728.1 hypothetical protein MCOR20_007618 [Pyricularia oryzae]KAI6414192.1 hypothetical protein MCOR24_006433 [Pyricularia oryzae]KAI6418553.1 hypothetical protein MCOR21_010768 [Pyricularia oryzae]